MTALTEKLTQARKLSWHIFGKRITFYLPRMFSFNGVSGRYPALSVTGSQCELQCDHCRGKLLQSMVQATTPQVLIDECLRIADDGNHGVLISGGCDGEGRLPWEQFSPALQKIKQASGLYISAHSGLIDYPDALRLKEAGVDQVLIDVIGDDETLREICHLPCGAARLRASLAALQKAGLSFVPHVVCGLHFGKLKGERNAVAMLSQFDVKQLVFVSLMRIPETPLWSCGTPHANEIAEIIAEARLQLPYTEISLGCARERGNSQIECLALDGGVNRMALPSEEAFQRAVDYGLEISYQKTCCSVARRFSEEKW